MTFWSGAPKNDLKNGPKTGVFDAILTRFTKKFTLVRGKIFLFWVGLDCFRFGLDLSLKCLLVHRSLRGSFVKVVRCR